MFRRVPFEDMMVEIRLKNKTSQACNKLGKRAVNRGNSNSRVLRQEGAWHVWGTQERPVWLQHSE